MNWLEVIIYTSTQGIEVVCGNLYQVGVTGVMIEDEADFKDFLENNHQYWDYVDDDLLKEKQKETCVKTYVSDNEAGHETLMLIKDAINRLKEYDKDGLFGRLTIELDEVFEEDWANNWKKYFHPIKIGKKLMIKPEWEELAEKTDRVVFNVNPGMTFGTGSHHTTQLCIEALEQYVNSDSEVLDLGCGSGILSVISLMLGAKQALAVDIDKNCVDIANANAKRNNVDISKYTVISGNVITDDELKAKILNKKYSVVFANIVADVIIAVSPMVRQCILNNGIYITSGIITDRLDEVKASLLENGFKIIDVKTKKDWASIVCTVGE